MKRLAIFLIIAVLASCTQQSQEEYASVNGSRLAISAEMTPGLVNAEFILRINGATAIKGRTQPFGGSSQTFSGVHQGRPVTARVTQVTKFFSQYVLVDVFYNGEHIETLTI